MRELRILFGGSSLYRTTNARRLKLIQIYLRKNIVITSEVFSQNITKRNM